MMHAWELLKNHAPSPLQELENPLFINKNIRLFIKRDDLLRISETGAFGGNKWRKLKCNLLEAKRLNQKKLLTFGGAYSNHLAAVAEAGQLFGFQTIGIVRGEQTLPLNLTLQFCNDCGMQLHYVSRADYKNKNLSLFINKLHQGFGDFYMLPEGGTNHLAIQGCREITREIATQCNNHLPNYIAVACGTGGTLAGIISELNGNSQAIGISVLKGDFLQKEVAKLLENESTTHYTNWQIKTDYHCGGYAKFTPELIRFINDFKTQYDIPLDPIYTGKLLFSLYDLIQKDFFSGGSMIVAVHTGGLQGITGFNERHKFILD